MAPGWQPGVAAIIGVGPSRKSRTHRRHHDQAWLQQRIKGDRGKPTTEAQKYILSKLNAAEAFETFLQTKYVGQKRFSLEDGETAIPLMDAVLDKAAEHELDEVVIGMPHRGRLNRSARSSLARTGTGPR